MKKRSRLVLLSVLGSCTLLAAAVFLQQPVWLLHRKELKAGTRIISQVESFRLTHKRPPESLKEIGVDDEDLNVYYKRINQSDYCVWFGTTLGESETYDSRSRKWEHVGGCD